MAHTISHQEQEHDLLTTAFVVSLIAGLWSLAMDSMSRPGVFGSWIPSEGIWPLFCISFGLLIVAGAILLCIKPCHRHAWGTLILLASALDFMFGAGGILGGVLGLIGGIIAIAS